MKLPKNKLKGNRFGQLLINALVASGDIRIDTWEDLDGTNLEVDYLVTGKDLFYLENDELETILNNYLETL